MTTGGKLGKGSLVARARAKSVLTPTFQAGGRTRHVSLLKVPKGVNPRNPFAVKKALPIKRMVAGGVVAGGAIGAVKVRNNLRDFTASNRVGGVYSGYKRQTAAGLRAGRLNVGNLSRHDSGIAKNMYKIAILSRAVKAGLANLSKSKVGTVVSGTTKRISESRVGSAAKFVGNKSLSGMYVGGVVADMPSQARAAQKKYGLVKPKVI